MQPLIGITTGHLHSKDGWRHHSAYECNALSVERAGGLPLLIPCGLHPDTLRAVYQRVDAVLIPGGGDIDPLHYGAEKHPLTTRVDDERDETELAVARWAVQDDRPLFGICRGHQVMNVALGGTLIQDIPSLVRTTINHDTPDDMPRTFRAHEVTIDPSSRLAEIVGVTTLHVNSYHHQSVEQPAPTSCVTAYAPDGVVEAIELPDKRFVLSVQWHPEDLAADSEVMQRLFDAFVDAARR